MDDTVAFARLLEALRPWLDHLVVVGGSAHYLLRYHPNAGAPPHAPLRTRDMDVAFSGSAPLEGDIKAALEDAGFEEEMLGESTPPVTHYRFGDKEQGVYVEFLVPRAGGGRRNAAVAPLLKAGVTAQRLRYVDVLLINPWGVHLEKSEGFPMSRDTDVPVANPASFIAQKLLIHGRRDPDRKAQDILYIHDTLDLFADKLNLLRVEWRQHIRPGLPTQTRTRVARLSRELFATVTDTIRNAARIPQDRALAPERIRAACAYGLEEVFGKR